MMSSFYQFFQRFRFEFAAQTIAAVTGGILLVVLARLLGPDQYGLLFLAIAVFGMMKLFSQLGIARSGARYIARYKDERPEVVAEIIRTSFLLNVFSVVFTVIALLIFHTEISQILREPALSPLLLLGTLYITFKAFVYYSRIILQGFEDIESSSLIHAIEYCMKTIFAISFVYFGFGAIGALFGYILAFMIASVTGIVIIYYRYYRPVPRIQSDLNLPWRIAKYSIPLTATSGANILNKRVDKIIVGFFLGPIGVAYYTLAKQIIQFIQVPASALGFTLAPSFETHKVRGDIQSAARIYEEALSHTLIFYIPAAAGLALIAEPLIYLIFGEDYIRAVPILQVFALYAVLQAVLRLTSNALDFLGRAKERAIAQSVTALMNAALNILLIPIIGLIAAPLASVIAFSMYTLANIYIIDMEFDIRKPLLMKRLGLIILITLIMSILVYQFVAHVSGFISLFAVVGLGAISWAVLSHMTGLVNVKQVAQLVSSN